VISRPATSVDRSGGADSPTVGNALNEVEGLNDSLMNNSGVLRASTVIQLNPDQSVTKLQFGDSIQLSAEQFERLATAFFGEIEEKFVWVCRRILTAVRDRWPAPSVGGPEGVHDRRRVRRMILCRIAGLSAQDRPPTVGNSCRPLRSGEMTTNR
jgi:hypothetical protein